MYVAASQTPSENKERRIKNEIDLIDLQVNALEMRLAICVTSMEFSISQLQSPLNSNFTAADTFESATRKRKAK